VPDQLPLPRPGEALGPLEVAITAERVRAYADASGDHNPIHVDAAFAETTSFGGAIAHGMLLLAYLARVLTARFGRAWVETGSLDARFRNPALVGSRVVVRGEVQGVTAGPRGSTVTAEVRCEDGDGQALVTATAQLICA
jgi:3-hydroxybutyryl-CoA dehydratase